MNAADFQSIEKAWKYLESFTSNWSEPKTSLFWSQLETRIVQRQQLLLKKSDSSFFSENAFLEALKRKIRSDSFMDSHVIYDDQLWVIFTYASDMVLHYTPVNTSAFYMTSNKVQNPIINWSYFSRKEDALTHSWLLWNNGNALSPMIYNDVQLTHVACIQDGEISIIDNNQLTDDFLIQCDLAFQAGPLVYQGTPTKSLKQYFQEDTYIGRVHNRTMLIILNQDNNKQSLWVMTAIKPITLVEAHDIVLRESRFQGEYETITIFNLDGGSSVAYRNPLYPQLNFWSNKTLPIIFEILQEQ